MNASALSPSHAALASVITIGIRPSACLGLGTVLLRSAGSQARPVKFSLRARHERRRAGIAAVIDFAPEKSPSSSPYPVRVPARPRWQRARAKGRRCTMSNDDDAELTRRVTRGGVTTRTTTKGGKKSKTKKEGELTMMRTGNTQNKKGGKGGKGAKGKGGAGTSKGKQFLCDVSCFFSLSKGNSKNEPVMK
ncbi:hypothetical protein MRX96_035689 [Rhipicephalus microplus]